MTVANATITAKGSLINAQNIRPQIGVSIIYQKICSLCESVFNNIRSINQHASIHIEVNHQKNTLT